MVVAEGPRPGGAQRGHQCGQEAVEARGLGPVGGQRRQAAVGAAAEGQSRKQQRRKAEQQHRRAARHGTAQLAAQLGQLTCGRQQPREANACIIKCCMYVYVLTIDGDTIRVTRQKLDIF